MSVVSHDLQRAALLYGSESIELLQSRRAIVFGVGGVGSWCAEALVRTGIGSITIVDADQVDVTNINRQLPATAITVDLPKVDVMAQRLREIRPECQVNAVHKFYEADNADAFSLPEYDIVIDAIDSLSSKADLILRCAAIPHIGLFSSMGAARRRNAALVKEAEFWKVKGCPLARALRARFKKRGTFPARKFICVYSDEAVCGQPKGTSVMVTASFGLRLAQLAIESLIKH